MRTHPRPLTGEAAALAEAKATLERGDAAGALAQLDESGPGGEATAQRLLLRARILLSLARHIEAADEASRAVAVDPAPFHLFEAGRLALKVARYAAAAAFLDQMLREHGTSEKVTPWHDAVYLLRGYCSLRLGDGNAALRDANACQDEGPIWVGDGLIDRRWLVDSARKLVLRPVRPGPDREANPAAVELRDVPPPYLRTIRTRPESLGAADLYPWNLAFVASLQLVLTHAVTFFVGENGCGKSTLIEDQARFAYLFGSVARGTQRDTSDVDAVAA